MSFVFAGSGAAGLMFEIAWVHRSALVFGSSIWATSLILSSFMAGLAVGNLLVTRFGHRVSGFLRTYALLELVVAVGGIGATYVLIALTGDLAAISRRIVDAPWAINMIRFVVAFAVVLVPSSAMGATLPVLVAGTALHTTECSVALGRLYGWNTLGAVGGVLAAETVCIRFVGVTGTAWAAALLNVAAATATLAVVRRSKPTHRVQEPVVPGTSSGPSSPRLLVAAFLCGAILMAFEVIWAHFLAMFIVSSTLSVSLVLAAVLTAISVGGLLSAWWLQRRPNAFDYLPIIACAAACASLLAYETFNRLTSAPWAAEWHRIVWFTVVLTFPTALLSGVMFTLIGAALRCSGLADAAASGSLLLANTIGAAIGPLLAAFVLLPRLGSERSFVALATAYGVVSLLAWRSAPARANPWPLRFAAVATLIMLVTFPFGLLAQTYVPRALQTYTQDGSEELVATREGPAETIFLMQKTWSGSPLYHRLVTNGFSMSGTHLSGKRYMRYFVYWPALALQHPIRRVLVVCYGVGVTVGAATSIPSVESVDVVEISRDIVAMSDQIYRPAEHPLRDPRVHVHFEDGRFFLQASTDRFDLITGEPPPPLTPGTVNLYTREYFQLLHDRLSDEGVATYWLPVARRSEYNVKSIIRAFCDVFDDCSLWNGTVFDWMLVGTRHARGALADDGPGSLWTSASAWPRLREIGFEHPRQVGATFLGDAPYLRTLTAGTLPLTDDFPKRLDPAPARLSVTHTTSESDTGADKFIERVVDPSRARDLFQRSPYIRQLWPSAVIEETLPFFDIQRTINRILVEGADPLRHIEELHWLLTATSLRRVPLWALGSDDIQQEIVDRSGDRTGTHAYILGIRTLVARQYATAAEYFSVAEAAGGPNPQSRALRAYAQCLAGDIADLHRVAPLTPVGDPDERHFWSWLRSTFGLRCGVAHPVS